MTETCLEPPLSFWEISQAWQTTSVQATGRPLPANPITVCGCLSRSFTKYKWAAPESMVPVYVHVHVYIYIYMHTYVYICVCTHTCVYVYVYVKIQVNTSVCVYLCRHMYVCMHACMYVYTHAGKYNKPQSGTLMLVTSQISTVRQATSQGCSKLGYLGTLNLPTRATLYITSKPLSFPINVATPTRS